MKNEVLHNLNYYRVRISGSREAIYDYDNDVRYTYNQMNARAAKLADYLVHDCCLKKGDCIGFCASNAVAFFDAYLVSFQTGIIITTFNHKLHVQELTQIINRERPTVLFYDQGCAEKVKKLKTCTQIQYYVVLSGDAAYAADPCYESILARADCLPQSATLDGEDIQMYLHTGGTTGTPKTAMVSYRAMFYNTVCDVFTNGLSMEDTAYVFLPLFHTSAWNIITLPLFMSGGRIILARNFSPVTALDIIARERPTVGMAVPMIYKQLAEHPAFPYTDFSCFRWLSSGGATAQRAMMEKYWSRGIPLANGYGMTEAGPHNMTHPLVEVSMDTLREKWQSVGVPMYFNSVRLVDEQFKDVPQGTCGELLFRGPLTFSGYLNNQEETKHAILEGGWVRTGDIACQDEDGYYYIMGRKKHMFITGGENIYTAELEAAISGYPPIRDVSVIGVADETWGEVGKAIVVVDLGTYSEARLRLYLKDCLSTIKIPKYIQVVDEMPLNSAGKKDYRRIRAEYGKPC